MNISIGRAEAEEVGARRCSVKKVFLKILQNSQWKTCASVSILIKLWQTIFYENRDSDTVFFCKFFKVFSFFF